MAYDLVLAGGRVVDPAIGHDGIADVGITDGRVADVAPSLSKAGARRVIDVSGLVVAPGLIDLHTHLYTGVSALGVDVDTACLSRGVTTSVDAGTAGAITFPGFKRYCIEPARSRVLAFLNLASIGLILDDEQELAGMRYADRDAAIATIEANRDTCLGVKVRMSKKVLGDLNLEPLLMALEIADATQTRIMVHITRSKLPVAELLRLLRPGDIVTHVLHGHPNTIIEDGKVIPELAEAEARGVATDVGHGSGSFSYETASVAFRQGFRPRTISTDLHTLSILGPVFDLPTTLSKFMSLGMSLSEVIAAATVNAARAIGRDGIGTLAPGSEADVAVFRVAEGVFQFEDSHGFAWNGRERLEPVLTLRLGDAVAGSAAFGNARTGTDGTNGGPPRPGRLGNRRRARNRTSHR